MAPRLLTISFSIFLISALALEGAYPVHAIPAAASIAATEGVTSTTFIAGPKELNAASGTHIQQVSEKPHEQTAPQQQLDDVLRVESQPNDQFAQGSTKATSLGSSSLENQRQGQQQQQQNWNPQHIQYQQRIREQQQMQQLQLQQQIQLQKHQQLLQLQQQKQLLQLQIQQQQKQRSAEQEQATTSGSESLETGHTKPLSGVVTSSAPGTTDTSTAGRAGGTMCYYDNVTRGLLHCTDGMSYHYPSHSDTPPHQPFGDIQLTKKDQHKKRAYVSASSQMYAHGGQVPGMKPTASGAPIGSVSQPAITAGTPPTGNTHPLDLMMKKRSSDGSEFLPASNIEAESWQPRSWNDYAAGCFDHEDWRKRGDMDEGWSKYGISAGSGYNPKNAHWNYGAGGKKDHAPNDKKGYGDGDKDYKKSYASGEKKKEHHERMSKRVVPAAGPRSEPEIISVPIDVNLLWNGKNVILLPGTTTGPGPISGYRGRRFSGLDPFGRPVDGIRSSIIPDENPDVIPVPIEIDMLVHPDGQMTLLPPDGTTI